MKPKVMFISAANSIHTVKWVNSLSKNFEIHLVYCANHFPNKDKISNNVVLHKLKFSAPLGYYLNSLQLKKMYNEIKPNIVNVHYASGYATLARMAKIPVDLLSIWGSDVYDFPKKSKLNRKILQKNISYAKYIASTSNIMAEELKKQVPLLSKKIYITPFGVDINKFNKNNKIKKDENFNIVTIKSLNKIYGIEYGILAVEQLINNLNKKGESKLSKQIKYYIYGEGECKEKLEGLIKSKNLQSNVFLMGKVANNDVPDVLNKMDVFCATSLQESFGVALIEAMACELPVIASRVDGFVEVMEEEKTGFLFEIGDYVELANKLEKLLKNSSLCFDFGKNGRKRVIENYNWEENVIYMEKIYKKLIKERGDN